jgi:tetratricopeptide (TPR) repeat protein
VAEPEAVAAPEPVVAQETKEQPQVREIDLSMEWAALSEGSAGATAAAAADSLAEEIEFYLQAGLISEAQAALERLQEQFPAHPKLATYQEKLAPPSAPEKEPLAPFAAEKEMEVAQPQPEASPAAEPLAEEFLGEATVVEHTFVSPGTAPPQAVSPPPGNLESELLLEEIKPQASVPPDTTFELSLEENLPAATLTPQAPISASKDHPQRGQAPATPSGATPPAASAGPSIGFLDEVFAEFRNEVEEPASAAGEDIETHYNMGVAFKEMALYDEAIGEFQKVHQLAGKAKDYSHVVQCCSLLATCFLEKGMPQLAVQWYQTALNSPGVDPDASLALLYEVGAAYEIAGDRPAALKSFMEVYARNIDYRNVAERIRELQRNS